MLWRITSSKNIPKNLSNLILKNVPSSPNNFEVPLSPFFHHPTSRGTPTGLGVLKFHRYAIGMTPKPISTFQWNDQPLIFGSFMWFLVRCLMTKWSTTPFSINYVIFDEVIFDELIDSQVNGSLDFQIT